MHLPEPYSHWTSPDSIPEGMGFVIQSPLAIGLQSKVFLCELSASAVNLILKEANIHPKGQ
jgi:hypothetical protein